MNATEPGQLALVRALVEHEVEFMLIGAHAVSVHGYVRATADVDIVPAPEPANLKRLVEALRALEAELMPLDIPEHGEQLDADWLAQGGNFQFETRYGRLDVMQDMADLTFRNLAPDAEEVEVEGISVRVCSYRHLLAMKKVADRPQDRLDLERLREARGDAPPEQ